jgi:hypothetical protein
MNAISHTTGLEPADTSRSNDHPTGRGSLRLLIAAKTILEAAHEHKAAGEVGDAICRLAVEARAPGEGERSGEGLYGENPQETAEVADC